jgi:hypothetical protein
MTVLTSDFTTNNTDIPLSGGHQFERLLTVFRSILNQPDMVRVSRDEVMDAATVAIAQPREKADIFWGKLKLELQSEIILCVAFFFLKFFYLPSPMAVASHIIRKRSQKFVPFIKQLVRRGSFIMKRLVDIAFSIIDARRDQKYGNTGIGEKKISRRSSTHFYNSLHAQLMFLCMVCLVTLISVRCCVTSTTTMLIMLLQIVWRNVSRRFRHRSSSIGK